MNNLKPIIPGISHTDSIDNSKLKELLDILTECDDYLKSTTDNNYTLAKNIREFCSRITNQIINDNNTNKYNKNSIYYYNIEISEKCSSIYSNPKIEIDLTGMLKYLTKGIEHSCKHAQSVIEFINISQNINNIIIESNYIDYSKTYNSYNDMIHSGIIKTLSDMWSDYQLKTSEQTKAIYILIYYYSDSVENICKDNSVLVENISRVQNNRLFANRTDNIEAIQNVLSSRYIILYYYYLYNSLLNLANMGDIDKGFISPDKSISTDISNIINNIGNPGINQDIYDVISKIESDISNIESGINNNNSNASKSETISGNIQGNTDAYEMLPVVIPNNDRNNDKIRDISSSLDKINSAWNNGGASGSGNIITIEDYNNIRVSSDDFEKTKKELEDLLKQLENIKLSNTGLSELINKLKSYINSIDNYVSSLEDLICKIRQLLCISGYATNVQTSVIKPLLEASEKSFKELSETKNKLLSRFDKLAEVKEKSMSDISWGKARSNMLSKVSKVAEAMRIEYSEDFYNEYKKIYEESESEIRSEAPSSVLTEMKNQTVGFIENSFSEGVKPITDYNNANCPSLNIKLPSFNIRIPNIDLLGGLPSLRLPDLNIKC